MIKKGTEAAVGIERPNTHKLRSGRVRLGEVDTTPLVLVWVCGLALILSPPSRPTLATSTSWWFSSASLLAFLSSASDMSDDGQSGTGSGGYKLEYCPNNRAACKGTYLPLI